MLLVVTTLLDPDLPLFAAHPRVTLVVPGHLSRPGWCYELGSTGTRLWTSRGAVAARDVRSVLTRVARVRAADLPNVHGADRDYVAAEMTAFLAALLGALPCPSFNRPTGIDLAGLPWTDQRAWRAAAEEGISVCASGDPSCDDVMAVPVLDGEVAAEMPPPGDCAKTAVRMAALTGARLVQVDFCMHHGGMRRVRPFTRMNQRLLAWLVRKGAEGRAVR
jgi:hypothetical protein